jgi:aspartate aminotransferase
LIGRKTAQGDVLHTDVDVVLYLLNTVGVAMIPGSAYGVAPYFRMSIATSLDVIEEGCRRIASALSQLS